MKALLFKALLAGSIVSTLLATLPGCAENCAEDGFADVRRAVADRTGAAVQWNTGTPDDAAVESAVRSMLAAELTADGAVQVALLNNRGLQATFEDLGVAQADLVQAGLLKNPVFDLGVRVPTRPPSKTYVDLSVAEDFVDVFFIPARKRLAEGLVEQAKARVTAEVLRTAADTKSAFYAYVGAEQLVGLRRTLARAPTRRRTPPGGCAGRGTSPTWRTSPSRRRPPALGSIWRTPRPTPPTPASG